MKASALEFRLRYLVHIVVYGLGLWAPWNYLLHLDATGTNAHVWGALAVSLSNAAGGGISTAFNVLLVLGIGFAAAGAGLRTWGSAYLGAGVVRDGAMHAGIVTDGPYQSIRNPLYLGTMLHSIALALLMPVSGAVFTLGAIGFVQVRLILGEEAFLRAKLGEPYAAYCALVPRIVPALRVRVAGTGQRPQWGQAVLGEIYMWGVAGSFAVAGWRYNPAVLIQCVIVCLGVSLVVRAAQGPRRNSPEPAATRSPGESR